MNKKDEFQFPDYDLKSKRITVTGGKGFLGRHLIKKLTYEGCRHIASFGSSKYNLLNLDDIKRMYDDTKQILSSIYRQELVVSDSIWKIPPPYFMKI